MEAFSGHLSPLSIRKRSLKKHSNELQELEQTIGVIIETKNFVESESDQAVSIKDVDLDSTRNSKTSSRASSPHRGSLQSPLKGNSLSENVKTADGVPSKFASPRVKRKPVLSFFKSIFTNSNNGNNAAVSVPTSASGETLHSGTSSPLALASPFGSTSHLALPQSGKPSVSQRGSISLPALHSIKSDSLFDAGSNRDECDSPETPLSPSLSSSAMILCRICEEEVKSSLMETHIKICAIIHELNLQEYNFDQRLKKIHATLINRKAINSKEAMERSSRKLSKPLKSKLSYLSIGTTTGRKSPLSSCSKNRP
ncbi:hypothetical protein BC830DRAFT_248876 [Chytriomyces sp. MP71]|nr:hypothetical protein BC830DRAFT_248876 [Chytriomyces sp. MP71]